MLAAVSDPELRAALERICAAVGTRVAYTQDMSEVLGLSRKAWSATPVLLLDEAAASRCAGAVLPHRQQVAVLSGVEPAVSTWAAAVGIGARHVWRVPAHEVEMVAWLSEAVDSELESIRRGPVIATIGGSGGAGASVFAVALAQTAGDSLLVDLDGWGAGLDLLLGNEKTAGLRWADLALHGGRLTWGAVREALPRHAGVSVLCGRPTGPLRSTDIPAEAVHSIVDAGRRGGVAVVCDLPRNRSEATEAALRSADLVVVVSPCTVRACAATSSIGPTLRAINPHLGLVIRGPAPGGLRAAEFARIAGLPLIASMRVEPGLDGQLDHGGLRLRRRSGLAKAAREVLGVLAQVRAGSEAGWAA